MTLAVPLFVSMWLPLVPDHQCTQNRRPTPVSTGTEVPALRRPATAMQQWGITPLGAQNEYMQYQQPSSTHHHANPNDPYSQQQHYGHPQAQPDMNRRNDPGLDYRQYTQQAPTQQHHQQHASAIQSPMPVSQHTPQQQQHAQHSHTQHAQHPQQHAQHTQGHVQQQHPQHVQQQSQQAQPVQQHNVQHQSQPTAVQPQQVQHQPVQQQPTPQPAPAPTPAPPRGRKRGGAAAATAAQAQATPPQPTAVTAPPQPAQIPAQQTPSVPTPIPVPTPPAPIAAPPQAAPPVDTQAAVQSGPPAKKSRTNTPWTPAEELRLKQMRDAGQSWAEIAKTFPTRTEGSVKKHWYKDMHYAEFAEDESQALMSAIKEYENNKWKVIGQKVGKPAKACEQYAKEHFPDLFTSQAKRN